MPSAVHGSVAAVAVPVREPLLVLAPQKKQRHPLAGKLLVHLGPHRHRAGRLPLGLGRRKQEPCQVLVAGFFRQGPHQPRRFGPVQVFADRRAADADRKGDLPNVYTMLPTEPKHFSDLAHVDGFP